MIMCHSLSLFSTLSIMSIFRWFSFSRHSIWNTHTCKKSIDLLLLLRISTKELVLWLVSKFMKFCYLSKISRRKKKKKVVHGKEMKEYHVLKIIFHFCRRFHVDINIIFRCTNHSNRLKEKKTKSIEESEGYTNWYFTI